MKKLKKAFDNNTLHGKILRITLVVILLAAIFVGGYFILRANNLNSIDKIKEIVRKGGVFSIAVFILFQILQTTVLQIPAMVVTIAGGELFGRFWGFTFSFVAIMVGSAIMFLIGRKAGRPFLYWMIGKDTAEKWITKISEGKYLFFLMMVFPFFPDDILCCVAGVTKMDFKYFFWTNVLARGLGIFCTVYFFHENGPIPFKGYWLILWAFIFICMGVLFYLSWRFKEQIDKFVYKIFKKHQNKTQNATDAAQKNAQPTQQNSLSTKPQTISAKEVKGEILDDDQSKTDKPTDNKKRKKSQKNEPKSEKNDTI